MKIRNLFFGLIVLAFATSCGAGTEEATEITADQLAKGAHVEAGCGTCLFELAGDACELAVKINGKAYFVDGATLDEFGDAHAEHGLCNAVSEAHVRGKIEGERFVAQTFELITEDHDHSHEGDENDAHEGHEHGEDGHEH